jgi:hypothetical protein
VQDPASTAGDPEVLGHHSDRSFPGIHHVMSFRQSECSVKGAAVPVQTAGGRAV